MAYYNSAQGQPQVQFAAPTVYYAAPPMTCQAEVTKNYGPHYAREASTGLGATQIVLATMSVAAGTFSLILLASLCFVCIGIWAGVFYLIAGSIAIAAGKEAKNNQIKATLVFSIFDILLGIAQLTIAAIGVYEDINCYHYIDYDDCYVSYKAKIAVNSSMIGIGSLEIIFGITLTALSARAIAKGSRAQPVIFSVANHRETVFIQSQSAFQPQPTTHPETVFIQSQSAFQPQPTTHPETVFIQSQPVFEPQPPPYYDQSQFPSTSTSNPPQTIYIVANQAPLTTIKL